LAQKAKRPKGKKKEASALKSLKIYIFFNGRAHHSYAVMGRDLLEVIHNMTYVVTENITHLKTDIYTNNNYIILKILPYILSG